MKKFNPSKNLIITLLLAILVVAIVSLSSAHRDKATKSVWIQSWANDSLAVVDRTITAPFVWARKTTQNINDLMNTYQENQQLKKKIDEYAQLTQNSKDQQEEIKNLQAQLELNATLTSFEKVSANVVTRSPDSWQELLVIDRGAKDGIEKNMAVMGNKGLIGRVIEVDQHTSKVELLTSKNQNSNHFPVKITSKNGNSYGLLKEYDAQKKALVVTELTGEATIAAGDVVQTSGLGGNSPADLVIGTVAKNKPDRFGLDRQVYLTPYANMYDIPAVTVIKRLAGE